MRLNFPWFQPEREWAIADQSNCCLLPRVCKCCEAHTCNASWASFMDPRFDLRPHTSAQSSLNPSTGHMHAYNINLLWGCLVCDFKQPFSVFKQNFTYFNVLFHPHVFSQIFSNNNFQFLNTCTKRALW